MGLRVGQTPCSPRRGAADAVSSVGWPPSSPPTSIPAPSFALHETKTVKRDKQNNLAE